MGKVEDDIWAAIQKLNSPVAIPEPTVTENNVTLPLSEWMANEAEWLDRRLHPAVTNGFRVKELDAETLADFAESYVTLLKALSQHPNVRNMP
jgi:uncharacterized protein (DUF934 family)